MTSWEEKHEPEHIALMTHERTAQNIQHAEAEALGQLVALGCDVTAYTPAPYRRPRLGRPSTEISSCGRLRA